MSLSVNGLSYRIGERQLFSNVTFDLAPATLTALTGPSGCGKTTLLNAVSGLVPPTSGSVLVDGEESTGWKERRRLRFWREQAAFVYQDHGIIEDETVAYNISFTRPHYLPRRRRPSADVLAALEQVGLASRAGERASHLSGGERQRVGIARALYRKAGYLFVDEPTASLDPANRTAVLDLLRLATTQGATVLMATHDEEAITFSDAVVTLG